MIRRRARLILAIIVGVFTHQSARHVRKWPVRRAINRSLCVAHR